MPATRAGAGGGAAEDAARAAHNVAIAAAVGDGGGGAGFEIDKAASPMSRVRVRETTEAQNAEQSTACMLSAYPYVFRSSATYSSHTGYPEESAFDASLGGRLASSSSE